MQGFGTVPTLVRPLQEQSPTTLPLPAQPILRKLSAPRSVCSFTLRRTTDISNGRRAGSKQTSRATNYLGADADATVLSMLASR